jgi:hypothetical protein
LTDSMTLSAGMWLIEADAELDGHILLAEASPAALSP